MRGGFEDQLAAATDEFRQELQDAREREEALQKECKSLAEAGLSIRRFGDQRFESAVEAMQLELKDSVDAQSLHFKAELQDLQHQHQVGLFACIVPW